MNGANAHSHILQQVITPTRVTKTSVTDLFKRGLYLLFHHWNAYIPLKARLHRQRQRSSIGMTKIDYSTEHDRNRSSVQYKGLNSVFNNLQKQHLAWSDYFCLLRKATNRYFSFTFPDFLLKVIRFHYVLEGSLMMIYRVLFLSIKTPHHKNGTSKMSFHERHKHNLCHHWNYMSQSTNSLILAVFMVCDGQGGFTCS